MQEQLRRCTTCRQRKPPSEFHRLTRAEDGLNTSCKKCRCAQARKWRIQNPEKALANYRATPRADRRAQDRAWSEANPLRRKAMRLNTYSRKKALFPERVPIDVLVALMTSGEPCVWCGEPATVLDHILALSRGGRHHESNLVRSCFSCNSGKSAKLLVEWEPEIVEHGIQSSAKVAAEYRRQAGEATCGFAQPYLL